MSNGAVHGFRLARVTSALLATASLALACSTASEPFDGGNGAPDPATPVVPSSPFVVSSPVPSAPASTSGPSTVHVDASLTTSVVYVSLSPGSIPNASAATISNARLGSSAVVAVVDGGFDPVPLPAAAGDTITIRVQTGNAGSVSYNRMVPAEGPPIIVRTSPPPHKRDVPLNVRMVIVFSEPIDPATVTATSVQLWRNGTQANGQVAVIDPAHLTATFSPDAPLAALTDYELRVTQGIQGLDGAPLKTQAAVPFTTATAGATPFHTVGGTVSGLSGTGLVLLNNGVDPLAISANGEFTFATALASGAAYNVTVFAQPTGPVETCIVTNGSGTISSASVTHVSVVCATDTVAPLVTILSPKSGDTLPVGFVGVTASIAEDLRLTDVSLRVLEDPAAGFGVFSDNLSSLLDSPGMYNLTPQLSPGTYTLEMTATDAAGNTSSPVRVTVVTALPDTRTRVVIRSFSVVEWQDSFAPGYWIYSPQLVVADAAGQGGLEMIGFEMLTIPGWSATSFFQRGWARALIVPSGQDTNIFPGVYGDYDLGFAAPDGHRSSGGEAVARLTYRDGTGHYYATTIRGPIVPGNSFVNGGSCAHWRPTGYSPLYVTDGCPAH